MELKYSEKGNYFRGLLILIGKDRVIAKSEKTMLLEIGRKLGFEEKFCNDAILTFLGNSFINQDPPLFSSQKIALNFIEDAINSAESDNNIHIDEKKWIEKIANVNKIEANILKEKFEHSLVEKT